jgi:predicted phage-related endonuclease
MTDQGKARDLDEAAARFAETLADSYRLVYAQAAESGERQRRLAQEFSELVATNLREQTEASRSGAQQLSEQASRQQEAGQEFARESVGAYAEFLDDAFSRYQSGAEQVVGSVQEGAMASGRSAAGLLGTATGAVTDATGRTLDATAEGAERTAETAVFPIAGYDEMNVEEISERLDDLSVEELQLVRDYEERNKRRNTLLEQMDRKIRAT